MSLEVQYSELIHKSRKAEAHLLLKALDEKQKKELVPVIKKLAKEYLEYQYITTGNSTRVEQKGTETQRLMLLESSFVCLNRKEFERLTFSTWYLGEESLDKVLDWYCPTWFGSYINDFASAEWVPVNISYEWVMSLKTKGVLVPSPELLSKILPPVIYKSTINHKHLYRPDVLRQWPETLEHHVWLLFEYDSGVNWSNRYLSMQNNQTHVETGWIDIFKRYTASGEVNRTRVLRSALEACNKNFNKTLSGWFAELFVQLEPTLQELVQLQNQLFNVFSSPHSKPVNVALNSFKKIVEEKEFKHYDFFDHVPLLLASETKSTVTSTLMLLEKLAKKDPALQPQVVELAFQTFLHNDDGLQERAAKLIQKFGSPANQAHQDLFWQYKDGLFSGAKGILENFGGVETVIDQEQISDFAIDKSISAKEAIPAVSSLDDVVFLCSQAFDNNEPYHLDLLPATLVTWQAEFKASTIDALEPSFQRAYHLLLHGGPNGTALLDNLLATFFVDYARFLMKKWPSEPARLCALHDSYINNDKESLNQWSRGLNIGKLENWKAYNNDVIYEPTKHVLKVALSKLIEGNSLPLLSTPTHAPCWLDPVELVHRLAQYQSAGTSPDSIDLQIALSRCHLENTEEAIEAATHSLSGEYMRLVLFLLQKESSPKGPFTLKAAWMVAGLSKSPLNLPPDFAEFPFGHLSKNKLTGQYGWHATMEEHKYKTYDYRAKKEVIENIVHKVLRIDTRERVKEKVENGFRKIVSSIFSSPVSSTSEPFYYEHLNLKNGLPWNGDADLERLFYLNPNNPEALLGQIASLHLTYSSFPEANGMKMVLKAIHVMLELWSNRIGPMGHLFLATCMLTSDKTIKAYAAEIWVSQVANQAINNVLIGEMIGQLEQKEYAPLKRFTDLVTSNMIRISDLHNRALETLLYNVLLNLPFAPVKNLKTLLQLYLETLSLNGSTVSDTALIGLFAEWKKTASVKKVIERIEKSFLVKEQKAL